MLSVVVFECTSSNNGLRPRECAELCMCEYVHTHIQYRTVILTYTVHIKDYKTFYYTVHITIHFVTRMYQSKKCEQSDSSSLTYLINMCTVANGGQLLTVVINTSHILCCTTILTVHTCMMHRRTYCTYV